MNAIDPCRCPLCSHDNYCRVAAGKGVCWCFAQPIPEEVLTKVPPDARGIACLCESCAHGQTDSESAIRRMSELLKRHG